MRIRTTDDIDPSTGISLAHIRGTSPSPILRAASAGNIARRSSVAVNRMLIRSSCATPLRSIIAASRRSVEDSMAAGESFPTTIAPRAARTLTPTPPNIPTPGRWPRAPRLPADSSREVDDLVVRQRSNVAGGKTAESDRTHPQAHESRDGQPHRREQPPNLTLASLGHDDPYR